MLQEPIYKKEYNLFTSMKKIPLGVNSYKGDSEEYIISLPYDRLSGAWGVICRSGGGKSVLIKRIYSYVLGFFPKKKGYQRTAIIFDTVSDDHFHSRFPNSKPFNLFWNQGEEPFGFRNLKCYCPLFMQEESHDFDIPFAFSLDDFNIMDFRSIGMGEGAAGRLFSLIKNNPKSLNNIEKFYQALLELPVNLTEFKRLSDKYPFQLTSYVNHSSKESLLSSFNDAFVDKVFVGKKEKHYKDSFIENFRKGELIVINFHQNEDYYPLYAGKILRDLYLARRESKRGEDKGEKCNFLPPVIIIEEAHKLTPRYESSKKHSAIKWLVDILKMGRKYDFFTLIATQEASSLHNLIKSNTRSWIIGKLTDNTQEDNFFNSILPQRTMQVVRSLDSSKFEFCIVYPDNSFDTFYAYNSPIEINRESTVGG